MSAMTFDVIFAPSGRMTSIPVTVESKICQLSGGKFRF